MNKILKEIYGELVGAEAQSIPSDDQIIMNHVRSAIAKLDVVIKTLDNEGVK